MIKYGKLVERIVDNVNELPTKVVDGKPWYVLNLSQMRLLLDFMESVEREEKGWDFDKSFNKVETNWKEHTPEMKAFYQSKYAVANNILKNCIIHIRVPREIKKYVEKTDNVKLVDIKGTKWFAVTEREKELIKEYLKEIDKIPERVWRNQPVSVIDYQCITGNNADRIVRNSVIIK
jgi:hypothetical protein